MEIYVVKGYYREDCITFSNILGVFRTLQEAKDYHQKVKYSRHIHAYYNYTIEIASDVH